MAKRIKAINALRPRLKRLPPIDEYRLAEYIADRSNLSRADVTHALLDLSAAIEDFAAMGRSVRLVGLGLITPDMNTQGEFTIRILPDPRLQHAINAPGRFHGKIINARKLRKTGDDLVAQWNELHPGDPVESKVRGGGLRCNLVGVPLCALPDEHPATVLCAFAAPRWEGCSQVVLHRSQPGAAGGLWQPSTGGRYDVRRCIQPGALPILTPAACGAAEKALHATNRAACPSDQSKSFPLDGSIRRRPDVYSDEHDPAPQVQCRVGAIPYRRQ